MKTLYYKNFLKGLMLASMLAPLSQPLFSRDSQHMVGLFLAKRGYPKDPGKLQALQDLAKKTLAFNHHFVPDAKKTPEMQAIVTSAGLLPALLRPDPWIAKKVHTDINNFFTAQFVNRAALVAQCTRAETDFTAAKNSKAAFPAVQTLGNLVTSANNFLDEVHDAAQVNRNRNWLLQEHVGGSNKTQQPAQFSFQLAQELGNRNFWTDLCTAHRLNNVAATHAELWNDLENDTNQIADHLTTWLDENGQGPGCLKEFNKAFGVVQTRTFLRGVINLGAAVGGAAANNPVYDNDAINADRIIGDHPNDFYGLQLAAIQGLDVNYFMRFLNQGKNLPEYLQQFIGTAAEYNVNSGDAKAFCDAFPRFAKQYGDLEANPQTLVNALNTAADVTAALNDQTPNTIANLANQDVGQLQAALTNAKNAVLKRDHDLGNIHENLSQYCQALNIKPGTTNALWTTDHSNLQWLKNNFGHFETSALDAWNDRNAAAAGAAPNAAAAPNDLGLRTLTNANITAVNDLIDAAGRWDEKQDMQTAYQEDPKNLIQTLVAAAG